MKVHQIWFNWGKDWRDNAVFSESVHKWRELCKSNGYEYHFWGEELKTVLDAQYPQYKPFISKLNNPQTHDFYKMLCIHHFGGIYIDMDVLPVVPHLEWTKALGSHFARYDNGNPRTGKHFGIDFVGCPKGSDIIGSKRYFNSVMNSYVEKYERYMELGWKGRLILQTTGPYHFARYVKTNKFPVVGFDATTHTESQDRDKKPFYYQPDTPILILHAHSWSDHA
jgi:hypothetical protein